MNQPVAPVVTDPITDTLAKGEETSEAHVSTDAEAADDAFRAITTQEEFDNALKQRLARAERSTAKKYDTQIKELESMVHAYENEKLSDTEKRDKRLAELEKNLQERDEKLTKLERDRLVADLAHEAGLPKKLWDRVRGENDDEITADIQELLEITPKPETKDGKKPPSQGATVKVQPTGSDGETPETAESIIEAMSPRYR